MSGSQTPSELPGEKSLTVRVMIIASPGRRLHASRASAPAYSPRSLSPLVFTLLPRMPSGCPRSAEEQLDQLRQIVRAPFCWYPSPRS
ncbi:hypothetical protein NUW54_g3490 [Trametes sanguinea]|uniref:Uncharacterized protein n=1 Tax=Trametes sanguinea TaxID=158606 RepID=A0ACC1Q357_9APHY|nr:hypothetical protein NUW54_g3490 [Trametes sanguinea]